MIRQAIQAREDAADQAVTLEEGCAALNELYSYLLSPKFHTDTTVQVNDVLARLMPVKLALMGAEGENRVIQSRLRPGQ